MSTAYIVVTLLGAALAAFAAGSLFFHARWVMRPLTHYGVPRSWWPWLATAEAAGAAGLLVGLFVPVIGVIAGIGLVLYFAGAVITAVGRSYVAELGRMRDGRSHLNYSVYHDRYQRTSDGWKFAERVYEVIYLDTTPLAGSAPHAAAGAR